MGDINVNNNEGEEEESTECSETELVSYIRQALKSVSDSGYEVKFHYFITTSAPNSNCIFTLQNYTDHYSQLIGKFSNNQRLLPDEVAMLVVGIAFD